ncbi:unnamed protein product [Camellia sinensis]
MGLWVGLNLLYPPKVPKLFQNPAPPALKDPQPPMSAAARSVFRSTSATRNAVARLAGGAKPKAARSPFRIPTQKPLSSRIFRSPVEMRFVCVDSLLPFHTATASALLTSMLSATPRCYGWTPEGGKTRLDEVDATKYGESIVGAWRCCVTCNGQKLHHSVLGGEPRSPFSFLTVDSEYSPLHAQRFITW